MKLNVFLGTSASGRLRPVAALGEISRWQHAMLTGLAAFGQKQPFELEFPDLLLKLYVASRDTMTSIAELVKEHPEVFVGAVRSTPEIVNCVEKSLNVELPSDVVWFLTSCGAASTGAISNEHAVVANTLRYRKAVGLPNHFVVLDERNDAGTVFLDAGSGAVAWVDVHAVSAFARGVIQVAEYDAYPNFSAWVADCIREIED